MRRLLAIVPLVLLLACGGDDDPAADEEFDGVPDAEQTVAEQSLAERLGDNPTKEQCIEAVREILSLLEVPDGVDPSDGLDDEERELAEAETQRVGDELGIDMDAEDDPCEEPTAELPQEEFEELTRGIDPDVVAMLGGLATTEFSEVGEAIEG